MSFLALHPRIHRTSRILLFTRAAMRIDFFIFFVVSYRLSVYSTPTTEGGVGGGEGLRGRRRRRRRGRTKGEEEEEEGKDEGEEGGRRRRRRR